MAARSLDVQSYIWHADLTGSYFAQELLLAADRGVRVRLLLDDMDARAKNDALRGARRASRTSRCASSIPSHRATARCAQSAKARASFERINRRMHNKSWIADNRFAIVGGRNIGDEYFGASDEMNFVDLDFAMVGPVVRDASASFDRYWNSPSAYPMEAPGPGSRQRRRAESLRERAGRARRRGRRQPLCAWHCASDDAIQRMVAGEWPMQWSDNVPIRRRRSRARSR